MSSGFTNTSITSGGDGSEVSATWENLRRHNPHIRYHSNRRGYISCTATAATLKADFKVLDFVTRPGSQFGLEDRWWLKREGRARRRSNVSCCR